MVECVTCAAIRQCAQCGDLYSLGQLRDSIESKSDGEPDKVCIDCYIVAN